MPLLPERRSSRGGWALALVVSTALHLIGLILISRLHVAPRAPAAAPGIEVPSASAGWRELEIIRILPVEEAIASAAPAPLPEQARERATPPAPIDGIASPDGGVGGRTGVAGTEGGGVGGSEGVAGTEGGGARTAPADRLRPWFGDGRLWTRPDAPPPPPAAKADIEVARARIYARLSELNDSLAAEATAATEATDWTVEDGDGGRWGFSPGQIHLGDITLPLPFGLSPSPGKRDEIRERTRKDAEIRDQAARQRAEEVRDERVKAIRERKAKEPAKSGSGSGTSTGSSSGSGSTGQSGSGSGSQSGSGSGSQGGG